MINVWKFTRAVIDGFNSSIEYFDSIIILGLAFIGFHFLSNGLNQFLCFVIGYLGYVMYLAFMKRWKVLIGALIMLSLLCLIQLQLFLK